MIKEGFYWNYILNFFYIEFTSDSSLFNGSYSYFLELIIILIV